MAVISGEQQAVFGGATLDHATVGPQKGDVSPYDAAYRQNPGTRVRLKVLEGYTQNGLIDQGFVFPAPPLNQLLRQLNYNWSDYDTVSAGQFSRPSGMQLQTISFDTIIVADDYPWVFYNPLRSRGWDQNEVERQLGKVLRSATPFWLIIEDVTYKPDSSGTATGISYDFGPKPVLKMMATLRQLTPQVNAGEPEAIYVNASFTEHRIAGLTQRKLGNGGSGTGVGTKGGDNSRSLPALIGMQVFQATPPPPATTLQDLAVTYYGSAAKWQNIKAANPWLGNITATHDLGTWDTAALKTAGKANKQLSIPVLKT